MRCRQSQYDQFGDECKREQEAHTVTKRSEKKINSEAKLYISDIQTEATTLCTSIYFNFCVTFVVI